LPFPAEAALRLASLRATVGLRMPDCCVLLVAQESRASVASFDQQLRRAAAALNVPVSGA
jgi:predicted nucleic acid-binding protein